MIREAEEKEERKRILGESEKMEVIEGKIKHNNYN